jgi:hypothetical protein
MVVSTLAAFGGRLGSGVEWGAPGGGRLAVLLPMPLPEDLHDPLHRLLVWWLGPEPAYGLEVGFRWVVDVHLLALLRVGLLKGYKRYR